MTCIIINDINDISDLPEYSGNILNELIDSFNEIEYNNSVSNFGEPELYNFYIAVTKSEIFINNEFNNFLINTIKFIKNKYLLTELLLTYDNNSITKIILHGIT